MTDNCIKDNFGYLFRPKNTKDNLLSLIRLFICKKNVTFKQKYGLYKTKRNILKKYKIIEIFINLILISYKCDDKMKFINLLFVTFLFVIAASICFVEASVDPDENRSFKQLIESRGFKLLEYSITTKDLYHLMVHRIVPQNYHHSASSS